MAYLRGGDYYAGDYYAGDPGIFSFLGSALKGVAGIVGGPVGALAGLMGGHKQPTNLGAGSSGNIGIMASGGGTVNAAAAGTNPGTIGGKIGTFMQQHPFIAGLIPAGVGAAATLMSIGGTPVGGGGGPMAGLSRAGARRLHPNKSTYVVRGGGTSHYPPGLNVVLKGTSLVPTRRMNVANPRALRRSLRRVAGFAKLTKRVRRAVSMAASAVGVHRGARRKTIRRR